MNDNPSPTHDRIAKDLKDAAARGPGNKVILFGSRTGPDGIGGASVLASATFGGTDAAKRRAGNSEVEE